MASGCLPDLVFQSHVWYNYIVVLSCFSWGHLYTFSFFPFVNNSTSTSFFYFSICKLTVHAEIDENIIIGLISALWFHIHLWLGVQYMYILYNRCR